MYDNIYPIINAKLCAGYEKEELEIKRKIKSLREQNVFDPCVYGQDHALAGCSFKKSADVLREMNKALAPFEFLDIIKQTHRQITTDIREWVKSKDDEAIDVNGDILLGSLTTVFLSAELEHPLRDILFVQYFSYINYNFSEVGIKSTYLTLSIYGHELYHGGRTIQDSSIEHKGSRS